MKRFLVAILCSSASLYGSAILVTDPNTLNTSDMVNWAQLGVGGQPGTFFAATTDWESLSGRLPSGTASVTRAGALASGPIAASDDLLVSGAGTASNPSSVTLSFNSPINGAGAYIANVDAGTAFTVRIQAFDGVSSVLSSIATVTSDAAGDPIFVGVSDLATEITKIIYTVTDSNGNPVAGDFALDKLYVQNVFTLPQQDPPVGVPEPGMTLLVGPALLAVVFGVRKRAARA